MSDEALYLEATKEVDEGRTDPAFWAKALAQSKGDLDKAKWLYIDLRVEAMRIQGSHTHKESTAPHDSSELKKKASQAKKKSWNQRANEELVEGLETGYFIQTVFQLSLATLVLEANLTMLINHKSPQFGGISALG